MTNHKRFLQRGLITIEILSYYFYPLISWHSLYVNKQHYKLEAKVGSGLWANSFVTTQNNSTLQAYTNYKVTCQSAMFFCVIFEYTKTKVITIAFLHSIKQMTIPFNKNFVYFSAIILTYHLSCLFRSYAGFTLIEKVSKN